MGASVRALPLPQTPPSERLLVGLIAAVQFISVLEFMIVMPLGPDFADALGIDHASLGIIGGTYTAAASFAGIASSFFIERFDRRSALAVCLFALVCVTALAGFATNLVTLLTARVLAGLFGGPATALALAMVADLIPPSRRGKAMGTVMGSFALASVLGIPAGLELARLGSWRLPFFAIAAAGAVVLTAVIFKLPPMTAHLNPKRSAHDTGTGTLSLLTRPGVRTSLALTCAIMTGMYLVIPNIPAYVQGNMLYPREDMSLLYLVGGGVSFFTMRSSGRLADRFGSVLVASIATVILTFIMYFWFVLQLSTNAVLPLFVAMMGCSSFRNIPYQTLTSQVPLPHERARFMSLQTSVQHIATTLGAFLSSLLLTDGPHNSLVGMSFLGWIAIVLNMVTPFLMVRVQRRIREQEKAEAARQAEAASPPVAEETVNLRASS